MNRGFHLDEAALRMLCAGLGSLCHHVDTFNDGTLLLHEDFEHTTLLATVFAGKNIDDVAFFDV